VTFAHPYLLLLLLLLPLAAWLKGRRGKPPAFLYSSVRLLEGLTGMTRSRTGGWLAALRWLALALLLIALAQPRLTTSETKIKASGVDIVVALDLSGSMQAEDFEIRGKRVNRLDMARTVLRQFIEQRPADRIGLVVFGTDALRCTPLTLDHDYLGQTQPVGSAHRSGKSNRHRLKSEHRVNRLKDLQAKSKIVILMTDGQNNAGTIAPLVAAEAAAALKVKTYTIGVGTRGRAPVPALDIFGRRVDNWVPVDIDEDTLTKIADRTGGKYYRADNAENFRKIYAEIDALEKTEAEIKKYAQHKELFLWFVSSGLMLLLVEVGLGQTVFRRLP
jgi:Ca-activated chloride channel family protein